MEIKVLSTKQPVNYSVITRLGTVIGIEEESLEGAISYYFVPEQGQKKLSVDVLEKALKVMISSNISAFEILYLNLDTDEYKNIAKSIFKEHWNRLYNMCIADDVFGRETTYETINVKHDFFEETE